MGIYIHVPFCGSICSYCHFARTAEHGAALRARYVEGVLREMELRRERCAVLGAARRPLHTCYLGGGTPSELEPELMTRLLAGVLDGLPLAADFELTAEANPESLTTEVATAWRAAGIERISLGVQSLDAEVLQLLGRQCDPATARAGLDLACANFERVSADWIIGPGLAKDSLLAELSEAVERGVEHFSVYILEVHEGTALQRDIHAGSLQMPSDAHTERLYLAVGRHLESLGFAQYEVANFARPGAESRHNRSYWSGRPYLGLGPGAHGFWGRRRYANESTQEQWLAALDENRLPEAVVDPLNRQARRLERAILALRTREGVPLDWLPDNSLDLERGQANYWWRLDDDRLILTRLGFLRIDAIEAAIAARILS
ncbi:MAG: radical SAM family heme chaperone HemW [Candidatus Krumholzibacteria bacterium]|nr:radical SAM family heme chaperone HemW [Candidatus Krumholzibacteria bacterium]